MSKQPGLHLKIEQTSLSPQSARVWIDGMEISHGLQELRLRWCADELTQAELTIGLRAVEMDARTIAHLTAVVERQREASAE